MKSPGTLKKRVTMRTDSIPAHSEIPPRYTWNAPSVFPSIEAWEAELASVVEALSELKPYQGHLADGPATSADAFDMLQDLTATRR